MIADLFFNGSRLFWFWGSGALFSLTTSSALLASSGQSL